MTNTENTLAPEEASSCPRGITFGETVTLSPPGEYVIDSKIAYFNNGDYVTIWTEKTQNGPRVEFQLFHYNNTKVGCNTCPGEYVTEPQMDIGNTAVGTYEDYTFLIAWSVTPLSDEDWYIKTRAYKYNVVNTTYTALDDYIPLIKTSSRNNGKFGFTSFSLDEGFALAYMLDPYTINIPIYKKQNNYTAPIITIVERVKSSHQMELIIKSVPQQYFFAVIWSPLMKDRGITVQNYRIDNGNKVNNNRLNIDANPREIFADLSYGGTGSVAWNEASPNCGEKQYLTYKAQMFTANALFNNPFVISSQNNEENLNVYLQQIIQKNNTRLITIFFTIENNYNSSIVKIYDDHGSMLDINRSTRNIISQLRVMNAQQNSDTDTDDCSSIQGQPFKIHRAEGSTQKETINVPTECRLHKDRDLALEICGTEDTTKARFLINDVRKSFHLYNRLVLNSDSSYEYYLRLVATDIFERFLFTLPLSAAPALDKLVDPHLFKYRFRCDEQQKLILSNVCLEDDYRTRPPNLYYNTVQGLFIERWCYFMAFARLGLFYTVYSNPFDKCIANAPTNKDSIPRPECVKYYAEAMNTQLDCVTVSSGVTIPICNGTSQTTPPQDSLGVILPKLLVVLDALKKMDFTQLPVSAKTYYLKVIGPTGQVPWELVSRLISRMYTGLKEANPLYTITYNQNSNECKQNKIAYHLRIGKQSNSRIHLCNSFNGRPIYGAGSTKYSQFHTIAHEITHVYGTTDDFDGKSIYGDDETIDNIDGRGDDEIKSCAYWKNSEKRIVETINNLIADCITLFISNYYCIDNPTDCTAVNRIKFKAQQSMTRDDNMPKILEIQYNLNVHVFPNRIVCLMMEVSNKLPHSIYLSTRPIMLNGFIPNQFSISGPSEIYCADDSSLGSPHTYMKLEANQSRANTINISDYCNFAQATPGIYNLTSVHAYTIYDYDPTVEKPAITDNFVHLRACSTFILGNPNNILLIESGSMSVVDDHALV